MYPSLCASSNDRIGSHCPGSIPAAIASVTLTELCAIRDSPKIPPSSRIIQQLAPMPLVESTVYDSKRWRPHNDWRGGRGSRSGTNANRQVQMNSLDGAERLSHYILQFI